MNKVLIIALSLMVIISSLAFSGDEKVKALIFHDVDSVLAVSNEVQADFLAPKSTKKAMELYSEASADYDKGKDLNGIKQKLQEAITYYGKGIKAVDLARLTFKNVLYLRANALRAGAPDKAGNAWQKAEKIFQEAAYQLEEGNINGAKGKAEDAENIYRTAELEAIKANYLNSTRELLRTAEKNNVGDKAPLTLAKAKDLASKAEIGLNENRYDTDEPRNLAIQAQYEAKHAIYLDKTIRDFEKSNKKLENLYLSFEEYLRLIAVNFDLVAEFDEGFSGPTNQIIMHITALQDTALALGQMLADYEMDLQTMKSRIAELEARLGDAAKEKTVLTSQLEKRAKIREMFAEIEKEFQPNEADVFRDGDNIIIRLAGLNFASGKSEIEPKYFGLLTKVQKAIKIFPDFAIIVQGHTDSYGGDKQNLELSQGRASAVREYLIANMNLDAAKISSVGYGETMPIANNETPEGRAKNRRVDIVIQPVF
jgi:OOP family OmpA-OmpF porin